MHPVCIAAHARLQPCCSMHVVCRTTLPSIPALALSWSFPQAPNAKSSNQPRHYSTATDIGLTGTCLLGAAAMGTVIAMRAAWRRLAEAIHKQHAKQSAPQLHHTQPHDTTRLLPLPTPSSPFPLPRASQCTAASPISTAGYHRTHTHAHMHSRELVFQV